METRKNIDFSLLLLRLTAGGIMLAAHGWSKFLAYQKMSATFPDPFGVGSAVSLGLVVFAEFICAALVAIGLFTRLAAIPLIVTMVVAAFHIHAADPWKKKELAVIYLVMYVVIFLMGPGKYSLQNIFKISVNSRIGPINWLTK